MFACMVWWCDVDLGVQCVVVWCRVGSAVCGGVV